MFEFLAASAILDCEFNIGIFILVDLSDSEIWPAMGNKALKATSEQGSSAAEVLFCFFDLFFLKLALWDMLRSKMFLILQ